jgi:hypothetical protein
VTAAAAVLDPEVEALSTNLWTFVHGLVHLRTPRPSFPGPDLDAWINDMIDRTLDQRSNA